MLPQLYITTVFMFISRNDLLWLCYVKLSGIGIKNKELDQKELH